MGIKLLTKHIFSIHNSIHKDIDLPINYVDGIVIGTNLNFSFPLGLKCFYSNNTFNKNETLIHLPFPIVYQNSIFSSSYFIKSTCLNTLKEPSFLYKHKIIYTDKDMKASDINIDKIIQDTFNNISTSIVININHYSFYFLNRLLKLPYKYFQVITNNYKKKSLYYDTNETYLCITILNLNNCKVTFDNNSNGVGIQVKIFQSYNEKLLNVQSIFTCLYSNKFENLFYMDGVTTHIPNNVLNNEINNINSLIKIYKQNKKKLTKCTKNHTYKNVPIPEYTFESAYSSPKCTFESEYSSNTCKYIFVPNKNKKIPNKNKKKKYFKAYTSTITTTTTPIYSSDNIYKKNYN